MRLFPVFERQSSAADWDTNIQLLANDDSAPMWTTVPVDLVLTMTVVPETGEQQSDYGQPSSAAAVITAVSTDATGRIEAAANGYVNIFVDDEDMHALAPDRYGVDKRYLVFIRIETGGSTLQGLVGLLPVYLGH